MVVEGVCFLTNFSSTTCLGNYNGELLGTEIVFLTFLLIQLFIMVSPDRKKKLLGTFLPAKVFEEEKKLSKTGR